MAQRVIVGNQEYEFPDGMSDKDIASALKLDMEPPPVAPIEGASPFEVGQMPTRKEMAPAIRPAMETVGQAGGGLLGAPLGPGGVIGGEIGGYTLASKGADYLLGDQDKSWSRTAAEGTVYAVVPRAFGSAVKAGLKAVPRSVADKLYRSASKMSTVLKPEKVREALDFAYENKIPVSGAGQDKLVGLVDDIGKTVDSMVQSKAGTKIDMKAVDDRIADLLYTYKDEPVASPYISEVLDLYKQFKAEKTVGGAEIIVEQANRIKRRSWVRLESYFNKKAKINPSRETTAGQDFYEAIGDAMQTEVEKIVPGVAPVNKQWGAGIDLQRVIDRSMGRISNKDLLSIMDPLVVEAARDGEKMSPGLKTAIARRLLEWPRFKSYLAIEIANASKRPLVKATPGGAAIPQVAGKLGGLLYPEDTVPPAE